MSEDEFTSSHISQTMKRLASNNFDLHTFQKDRRVLQISIFHLHLHKIFWLLIQGSNGITEQVQIQF